MRGENFQPKQPSLIGVPPAAAQAIQATQAAQAMNQQIFLNIYVPTVIQLSQYRVAHGYEVEGGLSEPSTPDRVAEEAWSYADAAMRRIGAKPSKEEPS